METKKIGPLYHPLTELPKNGNQYRLSNGELIKWRRYKPDGARQMGVDGRYQITQPKYNTDFYKWVNISQERFEQLIAEGIQWRYMSNPDHWPDKEFEIRG